MRIHWPLHLLRGILGVGMIAGFVYGLARMPLSTAYAIVFVSPLMVTALAVPLLGEKVGPRRWTAIALGVVGVLVVLRPTGEGMATLAGLAVVGGALCYAIASITVRKLAQPSSRTLPFSAEMRAEFSSLSVAIVGISGTGSLVAEMLLRMGIGELIVIDDDHVESKNLNRILNTTAADALSGRLKVDVFKDASALSHPDTLVIAVSERIDTWSAIRAAADADIVFSCVDTMDGRHIADRLATSMLQPLFDVGVNIPVFHPRGQIKIANIAGRIDFVQPGRSTLLDRGVYSPERLAAEDLRKQNPEAFEQQVKEGYMPGSHEEAPAVISVNMRAASMVVQELVARFTPYRKDNRPYARTEFDLVIEETTHASETDFLSKRSAQTALGLSAPLLGLPALEDKRCA
ncbi:ThiF family adenylyltransferase [Luteimonas fraxinea]|uniref:ThiF family adenylyltransferase n=1 Tax=Luteimonas fraxinea TaxID=2901869 RepID=UPI001E48122D|nr:ThiF family adenylyltransferase [Luteimonas fraxinea]MCD9126918.1 ThiF family adenylyltransferase [Luteimonas fraxinea]